MCGITGIWNFDSNEIDKSEFIKFTDSISHRGPDNGGFYFSKNGKLALGHRRLSILDLSEAGNQPMRYQNSSFIICYNGEVFNYVELRDELIKLGYSFKTNTDTEVVLASYIEWGENCLNKFNGMWAFIILNEASEEMFISRDRFGIKPLYYSFEEGSRLMIASETIAFNNYKPYNRKIDKENLARTIEDSNLLEGIGYTIYKGIYQLLPGHFMVINLNTKKIVQRRWWDTFKNLPKPNDSYNSQISEFRALFEDSCLLRLRSDVNIGTALSGGLDSSSVYCMLHYLKENGKIPESGFSATWDNAFVATFPGTSQDERGFAEKVIKHTGGKGNFIIPDYSSLVDDIVSSTKLFDSITATPIFVVSSVYKEMKKKGITVSMDGHGVDEVMYGYQSNVQEAYFQSIIMGDNTFSTDLMDTYSEMFLTGESIPKSNSMKKKGKYILDFESRITNESILKKWGKKMYHILDKSYAAPSVKMNDFFGNEKLAPLEHLSDTPYDFSNMSRDEKSLAISFHFRDIPYNLRDFDRASMQEGVEIRMPFMDWRLIQYAFALPTKSKIGGGFTKKILRDSMQGFLPGTISQRKLKVGLSAPIGNWLLNDMKELALDSLNSSSFSKSEVWDGKFVRNYFNDKYERNSFNNNDYLMLWKLINADLLIK